MTIYKIRNSVGEFANGTHRRKFSKEGKAWTTLHKLKAHLVNNYYFDCVIVEYEVQEKSVRNLSEIVYEMKETKEKNKQTKKEREIATLRKTKELEYERLKMELGK